VQEYGIEWYTKMCGTYMDGIYFLGFGKEDIMLLVIEIIACLALLFDVVIQPNELPTLNDTMTQTRYEKRRKE
jgi:hypothetical protein